MDLTSEIAKELLPSSELPNFKAGDSITVFYKIKEGDKERIQFFKGDVLSNETKSAVIQYFRLNLDVILSDMAADTTGNKSLDSIRTNQLCSDVINFSKKVLKPKGVLVSKIFMGEDFLEVKELAKSKFKKVQFFKPEASRGESKETYLHCSILNTLKSY